MTFCAIRMALDEVGVLRNPEGIAQGLPPVVSRKLYEIVAVVAMQFRGYIFKVDEPQARYYLLRKDFVPRIWLYKTLCIYLTEYIRNCAICRLVILTFT